MREAELWSRMEQTLGADYAHVWAETTVLADLGSCTVVEAISNGMASKQIWLAIWNQLELPAGSR